jgi:4-amino-4-deoxy-L-arabinose transferase-like glycosyltransferase
VPHTAYLAAIGVAVAVLVGAGLDGVLRGLRSGSARARRWALAAVATQAVWSAAVLVGYGGVPGAMGTVLVGAGVVAVGVAVVAVRAPRAVRARPLSVAVLVGLLLTPVVWTGLGIDVHDDGSASDAYAGPREAANPVLAARAPSSLARFAPGAPWQGAEPTPDPTARALASYLGRHAPAGGGTVLLTDYWGSAASVIVWFGIDARAIGGFSGEVADLTPTDLSAMIRAGRLPFALVHDVPDIVADRTPRTLSSVTRADADVVRSLCRAVPGPTWDRGHPLVGQTLYDCRR